MRVLIAGSRDFDYLYKDIIFTLINKSCFQPILQSDEILSGGARGIDSLAEHYSESLNIPFKLFPAKWNELGKKAGYVRNAEMVDYCDVSIVIWDGFSKGTSHTIDLMKKSGKPLDLVILERQLFNERKV